MDIRITLLALTILFSAPVPLKQLSAQPLEGSSLTLDATTPRISMDVSDGSFRQFAFEGADGGFGIYVPDANYAPFWISRFATPSMFRIDTLGVGIGGLHSPEAGLHIRSSGSGLDNTNSIGEAKVLVENSLSHVRKLRTMLEMSNRGGIRFDLTNLESDRTWAFQTNNSDNFLINLLGSGGNEFSIRKTGIVTMGPGGVHNFLLDATGNLTIKGTLNQASDRGIKKELKDIDPQEILTRVATLPITTWQYRDGPEVRHIGPMAQDFYRLFNVGSDDKTISVTDASGVALASIKALNTRCRELQKRVNAQNDTISDLTATIDQLSRRMTIMESQATR